MMQIRTRLQAPPDRTTAGIIFVAVLHVPNTFVRMLNHTIGYQFDLL